MSEDVSGDANLPQDYSRLDFTSAEPDRARERAHTLKEEIERSAERVSRSSSITHVASPLILLPTDHPGRSSVIHAISIHPERAGIVRERGDCRVEAGLLGNGSVDKAFLKALTDRRAE